MIFREITSTGNLYNNQIAVLDRVNGVGEVRSLSHQSLITDLPYSISNQQYYLDVTFSSEPDETYFVVSYSNDEHGELRRTIDGSLVTTLSGPVRRGFFSPDGNYLVVAYLDDTKGELRHTHDGSIVKTLSRPVTAGSTVLHEGITFSPDRNATYFLIDYWDEHPTELRRTADGEIVPLSGPVENVTFSSDEDMTYFLISYSDNTPGELRLSKDGSLVTSFLSRIMNIENAPCFRPTTNPVFCVIRYWDDHPNELYSLTNRSIVELSAPVFDVFFAPNEVDYVIGFEGETLGELRSIDKERVEHLSGSVRSVNFSKDSDVSYFQVGYSDDNPPELRRFADNAIISTLGQYFRFNPTWTFFVDDYRDYLQLRRVSDGSVIKTINASLAALHFPDRKGQYVLLLYNNMPNELRNIINGSLVTSDPVKWVTPSPDEAQNYFIIRHDYQSSTKANIPDEIRRTKDGSLITTLNGSVNRIDFSSQEQADYFFVTYQDNTSEVWQAQPETHRLAKLGIGLERTHFSRINNQLIVWYGHGPAYVMDLSWLKAMGGYPIQLTGEDLLRVACMPFAGEKGFFTAEDEARLIEEYLKPFGIEESAACQEGE